MNEKLFWQGLGSAAGVAIYVSLIATVMFNGEKWFGQISGLWGPVLMLMLLCLSVAIVGLLLFGQPAYLLLVGDKKSAFWQALSNIGWLAVLTTLAFGILISTR